MYRPERRNLSNRSRSLHRSLFKKTYNSESFLAPLTYFSLSKNAYGDIAPAFLTAYCTTPPPLPPSSTCGRRALGATDPRGGGGHLG